MHLRSISLTAILALSLVSFSCHAPHGENSTSDRAVIRLKWLHQAQFAGFYVAQKKGFYRDEHLEITLNPGGVDFPAIQMVASGSEQFGVTGADQILLARAKGIPVVALAAIYRKSPMVLFSLEGSGITKPTDFIGRKIGVKLGGNEELTYRAVLRQAKIDPARLTEVPVKYDMSPLFSRAVDVWPGYAINEVIVARENGHKPNVIWPPDYGVNLYADTLFTTEAIISKSPDLVRRVVSATMKGWDYACQHPEEAVRYTLQYSDSLTKGHEMAMLQASIPLLKPDNQPIGTMDQATWETMQRLMLDGGFLATPIDINMAYTTSFLSR